MKWAHAEPNSLIHKEPFTEINAEGERIRIEILNDNAVNIRIGMDIVLCVSNCRMAKNGVTLQGHPALISIIR